MWLEACLLITGFGICYSVSFCQCSLTTTQCQRAHAGVKGSCKGPLMCLFFLWQQTFCGLFKQTFLFSCLWEEAIKNQLQEIYTNRNQYFICVGHLLKIKRWLDHRHPQWSVSTLDHHHKRERALKGEAQHSLIGGKGAEGRMWLLLLPKNPGNHSVTLDFQKISLEGFLPPPPPLRIWHQKSQRVEQG